jgi:hypothetical protein
MPCPFDCVLRGWLHTDPGLRTSGPGTSGTGTRGAGSGAYTYVSGVHSCAGGEQSRDAAANSATYRLDHLGHHAPYRQRQRVAGRYF